MADGDDRSDAFHARFVVGAGSSVDAHACAVPVDLGDHLVSGVPQRRDVLLGFLVDLGAEDERDVRCGGGHALVHARRSGTHGTVPAIPNHRTGRIDTMLDDIHRHARERADELPGSALDHPFGPEWDVYKVRGKVFMLLAELAGVPIVNLKADPYDAQLLRENYAGITAGYHMNKKHWITVHAGSEADLQLLRDLVTDSYLLVVEKLPRAHRPVDPATFGR